MVIITVIWLSVKYQNFYSFQNVTSPPHAVNVLFISSHVLVSKSSLEKNLSTWQPYFPCRFFKFFFFTWSWIQFFFKGNSSCNEKLLNHIVRNWIDFWRAEFRCCGSLYSMLLFKKLYLIQIFNQYLLNKKDDTYRPMDTNLSAWI